MNIISATALSIAFGLSQYLHAADDSTKAAAKSTDDSVKGECYGVNSCAGKGECGNADGASCKGTNKCKGQGWITQTKKQCEKKKGRFKAEPMHKK